VVFVFAVSNSALAFENHLLIEAGGGFHGNVSKEQTLGSGDVPEVSLGLGYKINRLNIVGEMTYLKYPEEGNPSVRLRSQTYRLMPWARYDFFQKNRIALFAGLGVGIEQSTVVTRLLDQEKSKTGELRYLMGAGIGGVFSIIRETKYLNALNILLEAKTIGRASSQYEANLTFFAKIGLVL